MSHSDIDIKMRNVGLYWSDAHKRYVTRSWLERFEEHPDPDQLVDTPDEDWDAEARGYEVNDGSELK